MAVALGLAALFPSLVPLRMAAISPAFIMAPTLAALAGVIPAFAVILVMVIAASARVAVLMAVFMTLFMAVIAVLVAVLVAVFMAVLGAVLPLLIFPALDTLPMAVFITLLMAVIASALIAVLGAVRPPLIIPALVTLPMAVFITLFMAAIAVLAALLMALIAMLVAMFPPLLVSALAAIAPWRPMRAAFPTSVATPRAPAIRPFPLIYRHTLIAVHLFISFQAICTVPCKYSIDQAGIPCQGTEQ